MLISLPERLREAKIESRNITRMEPPRELTPKTVIYWSEHYKELVMKGKETFTLRDKAVKFLENGSIVYDIENKQYLCLPIKGYNSSTYRLKYDEKIKDFSCSCQGFMTKLRHGEYPDCCHRIALYLFLKIEAWNKGFRPRYEWEIEKKIGG